MINHCGHVQVLVPISTLKYWLLLDCVMKAYKKFITIFFYLIFLLHCFSSILFQFKNCISLWKNLHSVRILLDWAIKVSLLLFSWSVSHCGASSICASDHCVKSAGRKEHLCPLHLSLFIPCAFAMNADICKWNDKMLCACLLGPGPVWQCSVRRITRLSDSGS